LIATIPRLKPADSRIPHTSTAVITMTTAKARKLKTIGIPSTWGARATTSGIFAAAVP
jgi:hypothetical protein